MSKEEFIEAMKLNNYELALVTLGRDFYENKMDKHKKRKAKGSGVGKRSIPLHEKRKIPKVKPRKVA